MIGICFIYSPYTGTEPLLREGTKDYGVKGNLISMESIDVNFEEKSTLFCSTINLTNSIIGAGVLTLPSAFNYFGYFYGGFLLSFFGLVSGIACVSLFYIKGKTNRHTYAGMAEELFGNKGKMWVDWVLIVDSLGVCIGKMVLIGKILIQVFTPHFII